MIDPTRRLAPLTPLVPAHGILVLCWLLLFVFQAVLIRSRHFAFHRRMGIVALMLLTVLVPPSYVATVHMVHRGVDLSGDQGGKPISSSAFIVLVGIAVACRRRKEIHKRFMLFANISLMGAPTTHFLGYFGLSSPFAFLGGLALFFLFAVAGDYFRVGRVIRLRRRSLSSVFCSWPFKPS